MSATEFKWVVRKGNTARLSVKYQNLDGSAINTTGATGTLRVFDTGLFVEFPTTQDNAGLFELFLDVNDILGFDFRQGEYEFNVEFANGDVTTLVDGPLVVESGRGPFE